jgi:hypothetical protein
MGVWIAVMIAAVVGVGVAARRFRAPSSPRIDVGDVSDSWLREQRAEKRQDRY